jgi:hypothetical protein
MKKMKNKHTKYLLITIVTSLIISLSTMLVRDEIDRACVDRCTDGEVLVHEEGWPIKFALNTRPSYGSSFNMENIIIEDLPFSEDITKYSNKFEISKYFLNTFIFFIFLNGIIKITQETHKLIKK